MWGAVLPQPFPGTLIWTPHPPDPGISASQRLREGPRAQGLQEEEKWQESSVATAEGHRWLLTISVKVSAHPLLSQCKAGAEAVQPGVTFPSPHASKGAGGTFILASDRWAQKRCADPSVLSWLITW